MLERNKSTENDKETHREISGDYILFLPCSLSHIQSAGLTPTLELNKGARNDKEMMIMMMMMMMVWCFTSLSTFI